jgi:predicted nucleotidyltransferase
MKPPQLDEIIRRIVEVAHPQRIILFGSAARGTMGPDSDLDLLVVAEPPVHRRHLAQDIYERMFGVGQAVDIIVATPEDLERYGESPALVYRSALKEGKEVYAAPATVRTG